MKKSNKLSPLDYKYVPMDPEPDFDAEHNKKVIADSIKKSEAMARKKEREHGEAVGERSAAVARYLKGLQNGKASSDVEKYFGRKELARLRGEQIAKKIKHVKAQQEAN